MEVFNLVTDGRELEVEKVKAGDKILSGGVEGLARRAKKWSNTVSKSQRLKT